MRFILDFLLLILVFRDLLPVLCLRFFSKGAQQLHLAFENGRFNAFRLIVRPLVGSLYLLYHRFVGMVPGQERAGGCKNCEKGGTQSDEHYPGFAAMMGSVLHILVQMLGGDFHFFGHNDLRRVVGQYWVNSTFPRDEFTRQPSRKQQREKQVDIVPSSCIFVIQTRQSHFPLQTGATQEFPIDTTQLIRTSPATP